MSEAADSTEINLPDAVLKDKKEFLKWAQENIDRSQNKLDALIEKIKKAGLGKVNSDGIWEYKVTTADGVSYEVYRDPGSEPVEDGVGYEKPTEKGTEEESIGIGNREDFQYAFWTESPGASILKSMTQTNVDKSGKTAIGLESDPKLIAKGFTRLTEFCQRIEKTLPNN